MAAVNTPTSMQKFTFSLFMETIEEANEIESMVIENDDDTSILCSLNFVEELKKKNRHAKIGNYFESVVPRYIEKDFRTMFRMSRGSLQILCEQISSNHNFVRTNFGGRKPISLDK